jgi:hypothetical protein
LNFEGLTLMPFGKVEMNLKKREKHFLFIRKTLPFYKGSKKLNLQSYVKSIS